MDNYFVSRSSAGDDLKEKLHLYQSRNPILLALPAGGVEVARHAASDLWGERSVLITRKLKYPLQKDASFGAVAEDGSLYLNPWVSLRLSREMINRVMIREKAEIRRRIQKYRKGHPLPELSGRTVILIDDGIVSGSSMFVALDYCRKRNPAKLVVAAPAGSIQAEKKLSKIADEVILLKKSDAFYSVHQAYQQYENMSEKQLMHHTEAWMNGKQKRSLLKLKQEKVYEM